MKNSIFPIITALLFTALAPSAWAGVSARCAGDIGYWMQQNPNRVAVGVQSDLHYPNTQAVLNPLPGMWNANANFNLNKNYIIQSMLSQPIVMVNYLKNGYGESIQKAVNSSTGGLGTVILINAGFDVPYNTLQVRTPSKAEARMLVLIPAPIGSCLGW